MEDSFHRHKPDSGDRVTEKGHGRIETRTCETLSNLGFIDNREHWKGLNTIVRITAHRDTGKKQETETRFYTSSVLDDAVNFNSFIRQHWGIENKLHWTWFLTKTGKGKGTRTPPKTFLSSEKLLSIF